MQGNLLSVVPELKTFAQLELKVAFNLDSSNVGPREWIQLAKILDRSRDRYDAFLIAHGTDTLSYTASALSLMLAGFRVGAAAAQAHVPQAHLCCRFTCASCGSRRNCERVLAAVVYAVGDKSRTAQAWSTRREAATPNASRRCRHLCRMELRLPALANRNAFAGSSPPSALELAAAGPWAAPSDALAEPGTWARPHP